jgi:hypothetical protein
VGTGLPGFQAMMGVFGPPIHKKESKLCNILGILLSLDPLWSIVA